MMKLSTSQREAFNRAAVARFSSRVMAHVKKHFPEHLRVLGEPVVEAVVDFGVGRAREHGFVTERQAAAYVSLMLMLGSRFDEEPLLPWAVEILGDVAAPDERIGRLMDAAMGYCDRVAGEENEHLGQALCLFIERPAEAWFESEEDGFYAHMAVQLRRLYPLKCEAAGDEALRAMMERSVAAARGYGIDKVENLIVYVLAAFILGVRFDCDPQLPWAAEILNDNCIWFETARIERLLEAARQYLGKWFT